MPVTKNEAVELLDDIIDDYTTDRKVYEELAREIDVLHAIRDKISEGKEEL